MCGIAGYKCFGHVRPSRTTLEALLLEIEVRGMDATGIAYLKNEALQVHKAPITAGHFIKTKRWKKLVTSELPECLIMHTRAKTRGTEKDNKNNHPVFTKGGMALVHNGTINNYELLAKEQKLDAEVDSEIILKLIENKWWGGIKELDKLFGTFACAAIDAGHPDELILFKHKNPIVLMLDKTNDILFWASTKRAIKGMYYKMYRGFEYTTADTLILPYETEDDIAILVGKDGVKGVKTLDPQTTMTNWGRTDEKKWKSFQQVHCECCQSQVTARSWVDGLWVCKVCETSMQTSGACERCHEALISNKVTKLCFYCEKDDEDEILVQAGYAREGAC